MSQTFGCNSEVCYHHSISQAFWSVFLRNFWQKLNLNKKEKQGEMQNMFSCAGSTESSLRVWSCRGSQVHQSWGRKPCQGCGCNFLTYSRCQGDGWRFGLTSKRQALMYTVMLISLFEFEDIRVNVCLIKSWL